MPCSKEQFPAFKDVSEELIVAEKAQELEIMAILKNLDPTKSAGPDKIPVHMIKSLAKFLAKPLAMIINSSLKFCQYPAQFKEGLVMPVLKKGKPNDVTNYRPITLLNVFNKVVEKWLLTKLTLQISPYVCPEQHGFVKNKSTMTNLVTFTNHVAKEFDNRGQLDVCNLDIEKAFDSVDHEALCVKLKAYGINDCYLKLVKSYLSERINKVIISGHVSVPFSPSSGVTQGSLLGPFFFIVFINDLTKVVKHSDVEIFADDLRIHKSIINQNDCLELQNDISNICDWCDSWKLSLKASKCSIMSFTLKKKPIEHDYYIKDQCLSKMSDSRDLGVTLTSNLNYSKHVNEMVKKAFKMLGYLKRTCVDFHNPCTILLLYKTLIRSNLEYATILWNADVKYLTEKVERVQKKFLKYFCYKFHDSYSSDNYEELCNKYNIPPLCSRRSYLELSFLYKIYNSNYDTPNLLNELNIRVPSHSFRDKSLFYMPTSRVNASKQASLRRITNAYNILIQKDDSIDLSFPLSKYQQSLRACLY